MTIFPLTVRVAAGYSLIMETTRNEEATRAPLTAAADEAPATATDSRPSTRSCGRTARGSLFPAESPWSSIRTMHCRDCGRPMRYDKFGKFEHREREVRERDAQRLLTMERQFCILCWGEGKRVRVLNVAERVGRTEKAYRALRRRRLAAHLRVAHPGWPR